VSNRFLNGGGNGKVGKAERRRASEKQTREKREMKKELGVKKKIAKL